MSNAKDISDEEILALFNLHGFSVAGTYLVKDDSTFMGAMWYKDSPVVQAYKRAGIVVTPATPDPQALREAYWDWRRAGFPTP